MANFQDYIYLLDNNKSASSTSEDANGITINYHNADADFITQSFGADKSTKSINVNVKPDSITGTGGTLTLQFSDDGINWKTMLDDTNANIEWTINNTFSEDYALLIEPKYPHYRLNYTSGSVSAGTLSIRLMKL